MQVQNWYDAGHKTAHGGSNLARGPLVWHPCPRELANYRYFYRNFRTTDARRPIKGSQDAGFRLRLFARKKNLSLRPRVRWRHQKNVVLPKNVQIQNFQIKKKS